MCVYMYMYIYVYVYIYIYMYMYIYIHTYIHTYIVTHTCNVSRTSQRCRCHTSTHHRGNLGLSAGSCSSLYCCAMCYVYVCMCVCVYVCVCCMYVCTYVCMHACMYACMHVCMYACMHVCMYACMHVCMYACMHVCMRACIHTCMHVLLCGVLIKCASILSGVQGKWLVAESFRILPRLCLCPLLCLPRLCTSSQCRSSLANNLHSPPPSTRLPASGGARGEAAGMGECGDDSVGCSGENIAEMSQERETKPPSANLKKKFSYV